MLTAIDDFFVASWPNASIRNRRQGGALNCQIMPELSHLQNDDSEAKQ